ncbi:MAG: hypothetical protein ACRD4P_05575 [Bryobacteraceae bacterium]
MLGFVLSACALAAPIRAQVIDFESNGLHYKTMTKGGLTVMFAVLPSHVRSYAILQVSVSNGSPISWTVRPEDFHFDRADGNVLTASDARMVIDSLIEKASRGDVIRLVTAYEAGLYGNTRLRSSDGYEERRRAAMAEMTNGKLKAAAAASAIAFVPTKLMPGQSTDGAIFFSNGGKPLGQGRLLVHAGAEDFDFTADAEAGK